MHRTNISSEPTTPYKRKQIDRRNTATTTKHQYTTSSFENEAMQVFNQVTANKNRLLTKNSNGFYTKTTVKTRKFDPNGKEVVEKFEATTYGGLTKDGEKLGEVVQKYYNEKTGIEKTSLQRILGNKVKKIEVKKSFDFELRKEYSENFDGEFEKQWRIGAKELGVRKIVGFESKVSSISPKKSV